MKIEKVLANNPGVFTGPGTNTWILDDGRGRVTIIDPGPVDGAHETSLMERVAGRVVESVLVTHTHLDHAPLANPLATNLGIPAIGYAPGPEFDPDLSLSDGETLAVGELTLKVVHTPGHAGDHLCFRVGDVLFTGDHIMGGSSVMVEEMGPYIASLEKLRGTGLAALHPGHGDSMDNPESVIDWYLAHRKQRHEQIYRAVVAGAKNVTELVETVYHDVDKSLYPLAAQSVRAHLVLLSSEGRIALSKDDVVLEPPPSV